MKRTPFLRATSLAGFLLAILLCGCSQKEEPVATGKPYPLDTCLVCGMKLSMMDKPYTFTYEGQQIKVCDAGEKADFDKNPSEYLKKIEQAGTGSPQ